MGTTVTTNLQLIKPDQNESIKQALPTFPGWASQNATNQDKIDSVFRNSSTTYTLNWTGAVSNPAVGSGGFTEGKYVRLFPRLVIVFFRIWLGNSGIVVGSGEYRISAPFSFDPIFTRFTDTIPIGRAAFFDASAAATCSTFTVNYRSSENVVVMRPPEGGFWAANFPVVPAIQDRWSGYFMYPTTAA